jgi:glycosyltransferase involved in cell wall biosynthesis
MSSRQRTAPRVIHLADYGGAYSGSFIPMLVASASAAREKGWAVELIFSELARERPWLGEIERDGIPYRFLEARRTGLSRWAGWMTAEATATLRQDETARAVAHVLAEAQAATILHTHFSAFDIAAAHAGRSSRHASVVWHHHSMRRPGWKSEIGGALTFRVFGRDVSAFLCVAPDVTEAVARLAGRKRVTFFPNAVDVDIFALPDPEERTHTRANLGIAPEARVLLHFGFHWLRKGGDLFLAAVQLLSSTPAADGVVAITVGGEDAKAAVEAAGLGSCVRVLEPTESVRDLYAAADLLVSPSRSEGMPLAILEALAMGLPVIASDIPGQAYVANAVAACRLTSVEPGRLAAAIAEALTLDGEQRAHERRLARQWVVGHMSLGSWAQRLMEVYERLLHSR